MSLLTSNLVEGRMKQKIRTLLGATRRAVLCVFEVPERNRYQIVHEDKAHHMVIDDIGLGLTRARDLVCFLYTPPSPRDNSILER